MSKEKTSLFKEAETYEKNKENLLRDYTGKYVLIKGDKIIGVYDTRNDAIKVGIDKFGNTPFLVKKILEIDEVVNFTSNMIGAFHVASHN